jgi:hypothetical protein
LLSVPLFVMLTAYYVFSAKSLSWQKALWLIIAFVVHVGLIGYQYLAINNGDAVWREFSAQNITQSPDVIYYILGYLPFIIPIVAGIYVFAVDKPDHRWWLPLLWVLIVASLLYAPIPTQRRYLLGVQTPLAALAAYSWIRGVMPRFNRRLRPLVTGVYITFAAIASALMIVGNIAALAKPYAANSPFYSPDELAGYTWLQREANRNDLVLTTLDLNGQGSGGRLVSAVGQRVFIGHWIETIDFTAKVNELRMFYDPLTADDWRETFLRDTGVIYVWYDDYARALGDWDPTNVAYLETVFTAGDVTIFRVINDG